MWLTGPAAPRHVGSSQTRARTRVPCIGRQILNHCATREAQVLYNRSYYLKVYDMDAIIVPIFEVRKLRLRKVKNLVKGHVVSGRVGLRIQLSDP